MKCQFFGEHKAAQCMLLQDVCGRCGGQHRTSTCVEKDRNMMACSNCRAANNGQQKGHGAADRRCPIFLVHVDRLNKTRKENSYRFYCTTDPATWENNLGNYGGDQALNPQSYREDLLWQEGSGGRGRLGGGLGGEGGGGVQRGVDNGWGGVRVDTRQGVIKRLEAHKQMQATMATHRG